jgi:hypothetical protein
MIDEVCCLSDPSSHFSPLIERKSEREREFFLSASEKEKRDNIASLKEKEEKCIEIG